MSKIVFINPLADFGSSPVTLGSWNNYFAPELLRDFFEGKGINSDFVNLNDLFVKKFFSEEFCKEFLALSENCLSALEECKNIGTSDLLDYLSLKFMLEIIRQDGKKGISVIDSVRGLMPMANLLMKDADILQPGTIKIQRDDADFSRRVGNFDRVMSSVLSELDFDGRLLVFSVPSKSQMSSLVQTGRLVKKMFPHSKILIGGSYVKFTNLKILNDMVAAGIIDFYIKDADEGKLLCLAREFLDGSLGDFKGNYTKFAEHISINDLVRRNADASGRQGLLLSNGCYWGRCRYCEFPVVRTGFEVKKTNVVVDEIEYFYKKGVREFRLFTDCLIPALGVNIAKELIRRNIKIKWHCYYMRVDAGFTKDVILLLKESGFQFESMVVGMESCIDAALKSIDKGYDRKTIETFFNNFRELGIKFSKVNIIFDIPGTTASDFADMRKFVLDLFDVTRGVVGAELFLSDKVEFGMHPEKYNIKVLGADEKSRIADRLLFEMKNGFSAEDRHAMEKFFNFLGLLFISNRYYPMLDTAKLAGTKIYSEKDFRLLVKTGNDFVSFISVFDDDREIKTTKFTVPAGLKEFDLDDLFLLKFFDRLNGGRWYSVADIVDAIGYSSPVERLRLMQKVFHGVIAVLAGKGFADAKIEITAKIAAEAAVEGKAK